MTGAREFEIYVMDPMNPSVGSVARFTLDGKPVRSYLLSKAQADHILASVAYTLEGMFPATKEDAK